MNSPEQTSLDETTGQPQANELPAQPAISWSQELRRRNRHLRELLETEEAAPVVDEPWRLKLIHRALFSTWLDERSVKRARRNPRRAA